MNPYLLLLIGFIAGVVFAVKFKNYMGKRLSRKKDVGVYCEGQDYGQG